MTVMGPIGCPPGPPALPPPPPPPLRQALGEICLADGDTPSTSCQSPGLFCLCPEVGGQASRRRQMAMRKRRWRRGGQGRRLADPLAKESVDKFLYEGEGGREGGEGEGEGDSESNGDGDGDGDGDEVEVGEGEGELRQDKDDGRRLFGAPTVAECRCAASPFPPPSPPVHPPPHPPACVQSPSDVNLALGQTTASQSGSNHAAAVDGDRCTLNGGGCTIFHSGSGYNEWWEVTLAAASCVTRVYVANAWDHCCRERIVPFKIKLLNANDQVLSEQRYDHTAATYEWTSADTVGVVKVRLQLDDHSNYLHVGEVEVYGPS